MGWLNDLFAKAAPVRRASDEPASPSASRSGKVVVVTYSDVVSAEMALKHPVVYRCVNKIAESVQTVKWYCDIDPDVPVADRAGARVIKDLNDLLKSPNDNYPADQMRYWLALNYCLYGRVPVKIGVGTEGRPNGIYPLTTRWVQAILNTRGLLEGYQYGEAEQKETLPTRRKAPEGKAYAYEIARPNLDGTPVPRMNSNVSPATAIGLPAQVIRLLLQRAVDTASGHPNTKYIVVAEKTLTKKQKNELVNMVEETEVGEEKSGNILFLYNTNAKIEKLDNDLSDIHSKMPMDDMSRMIAGAFGVPIALIGLGAADAAKFASNYTESRRAFWADTIIPGYLSPIATGMTAAICPPGARIFFDLDTIDALRDHNIANAEKLTGVGYLTKDEKRSLIGFEPLPAGKGGDELDATKPKTPTTPPADPTE